MEIKIKHQIGIIIGIIVIALDFVLFYGKESRLFKPLIAVGIIIAIILFWIDFLQENKRQKEVESKFLEFVRALVETVKTGVPIPKAIMQISHSDFGALTPYVNKLANQIEWGIPLRNSLRTFAIDANNKVINRSVSIVIEAEQSGGHVDDILQAVTNSVLQVKKIKEERKASQYEQAIQGYIVFFIFIAIMVVMQVYLMPQLSEITSTSVNVFTQGVEGITDESGSVMSSIDLNTIFLWLVIIQGFFAGIMIGKFAEGDLKSGLKHSLILMVTGYLSVSIIAGI